MTPAIVKFSRLASYSWDEVLQLLDLASIQNLRLASRALRDESLPRFTHFLENKTTDLSKESLQSLASLSAHPLGQLVKRLTVVAIVYDTSRADQILSSSTHVRAEYAGLIATQTWMSCTEEELASARADAEWLRAKQQEQAETSFDSEVESLARILESFTTLHSLELDAALCQSPPQNQLTLAGGWSGIWRRASRVCRVALSAVARSRPQVEELKLFSNTFRCSVSVYELEAHMQSLRGDGFASVKSLAVSVCRESTETREDETLAGVADLVQQMPNLESLDIHYYRIASATEEPSTFRTIAPRLNLPSLRHCALRGLFADSESLIQFLTRHPSLTSLQLGHIHIPSEWAPLIPQIPPLLPDLKTLHLSGLRGAAALTNLFPTWDCAALRARSREWSYPYTGHAKMVHTVVLEGDDLRRPLEFRQRPRGRPLGSGGLYIWMKMNRRDFGPP